MKVVVTGGAGFIGSHLVEALVERGDRVTVIDDFSTGSLLNLLDVQENIHVESTQIDILQIRQLASCDVIYHLAADIDVAESMRAPGASAARNIRWVQKMLEYARVMGVPRFVFASSCAAAYNANPYGASKLCGEVLCEMYSNAFGIDTVSLRFQNVYGPRQRADLPNPPVVAAFVKAACEGESMQVHGDGIQSRDFVYVDDIVRELIRAGTETGGSRILATLSTGVQTAIVEVAELVEDIVGVGAPKKRSNARQGDVRKTMSRRSLAEYVPIQEGIKRTVEWYRRKYGSRTADESSDQRDRLEACS